VKRSDLIESFFERTLNFFRAIGQLDPQCFEFQALELQLQSGAAQALRDDIVQKPFGASAVGFHDLQDPERYEFQFRRGRHRQPRAISESGCVSHAATGIVDGEMNDRVIFP
jgi:hypothetical protein